MTKTNVCLEKLAAHSERHCNIREMAGNSKTGPPALQTRITNSTEKWRPMCEVLVSTSMKRNWRGFSDFREKAALPNVALATMLDLREKLLCTANL